MVTKELTPTKKLDKAGGAWLKRMVDYSLKKDDKYFRFMGNLRNLLEGKHWENVKKKKDKDRVRMVVNLAHAHVRTLVPTLFFKNPSIDSVPTAPQHSGKEKTWNAIINNTLDKVGFADEMKKVVMDAVTYPEGVMKDVTNRVAEGANEEMEAGDRGPVPWGDKGTPSHVRIAPTQLIVDYISKDRDTDNARFVAIRYRKPLQELKFHKVYGPNVEAHLTEMSDMPTTGNLVNKVISDDGDWDDPTRNTEGDPEETLVTIYEVWISRMISSDGKFFIEKQMCTLLEGQDKPIRELTPWSEVMGEGFNTFPVTRLVLVPVPDALPNSELGAWQEMQMGINWLMSRITELVENDRQLYETDTSKIKNPAKFRQQFYKGRSRELVEVSEPGAINLIQPSFVGRDNYTLVNLLQSYIQQVSGIGQNRRGGSGIRTATEASLVDQGTQIKTDEKVDSVEKFLIRVVGKCAMITRALAKNDLGIEWVYRVSGDAGAVDWVAFSAEDISWLPEIRIRVNSFRKSDSSQDMQKIAMLLQQGMALYQLYGPTIRVDILYGRMLEAAGISDSGKIIGDQDQQMMLQTIELAALMVGELAPVLEEHNHAAHMEVLDRFVNSENGQKLMASAPEIGDALQQHRQEHEVKLQEQQQKAQRVQLSQDPFAAAGQEATPNAQSQASGETSGDRTAVQSVPGGQGQFQ
mgnify:FL=1|tara:strand:- start:8616 stop:10691 length:2076 start_codon:yes stop_codon:yes gene_type:complete